MCETKTNGEPNALAVLDRATQAIRKDLGSRIREEPRKQRTQVIDCTIATYNRTMERCGALEDPRRRKLLGEVSRLRVERRKSKKEHRMVRG